MLGNRKAPKFSDFPLAQQGSPFATDPISPLKQLGQRRLNEFWGGELWPQSRRFIGFQTSCVSTFEGSFIRKFRDIEGERLPVWRLVTWGSRLIVARLSCRTGGWREDPADGGGEPGAGARTRLMSLFFYCSTALDSPALAQRGAGAKTRLTRMLATTRPSVGAPFSP